MLPSKLSGAPAAPTSRAASLLALTFPSDPQVSPDGQSVAYVLTRSEDERPEKDRTDGWPRPRYRSQLWLVRPGEEARAISSGPSDSNPRWSPDGQRLVFVSDRAGEGPGHGKPQLYLLPLHGGEAQRLTNHPAGASQPQWSPDGRFISYTSGGDYTDRHDERGEARVHEELVYKSNGRGYLTPPASLYRYEVASGQSQLWYTPPTDLTDHVWWPDSRGLLLAGPQSMDDAAHWRSEAVSLDLAGEATLLTRWASALHSLSPHPDGERFAALGRPTGSRNDLDTHVYLFGPGSDGTFSGQRLDQGFDGFAGVMVAGDLHVGALPGRPVWLAENTLLFPATVGGDAGLYTASLHAEVRPQTAPAGELVAAFTRSAHGQAELRESPTRPTAIFLNGVQVSPAASLPFVPVAPQRVTFATDDGQSGEGWVLLPPGDGPFPATLHIHGGPHAAYGNGFMHEFQTFVQAGYAVCYSNPRGSVGYGQAWSDAIQGRWGTVDLSDLLSFFDACLAQFPALDPARTAVMGGSYGGYMTNVVTTRTGRFRAAVTDRSICNLISFGGTSDIGMRFWDDELGGNFQRRDDAERLWAMSPLRDVQDVTTPTLIIHSQDDLRCPVEQAEQWFAALKLHGVPTRFVRFPGENHELSRSGRPDRRMQRIDEYLEWLDRYV